MSKHLFLIRHAKSSWGNGEIADWYRPLNDRGYRDAPEMATRLKKAGIVPDLIVTSPAIRAYSTSMIFADVLKFAHNQIQIIPKLYGSGVNAYLSAINDFPDTANTVFLFAHNPTISQTLELLAGLGQQELPTCGIAHIQFAHESWKTCAAKSGKLMLLDYPKNGLD